MTTHVVVQEKIMLCALILPLISSEPDTGQRWLDAWNQRLRTAKTISGQLEITGGGIDEKVVFQMSRPNRFRMSSGSIESFCDGIEALTYLKEENKFFKDRPGRRLPLISMTAFGMEALSGSESNFAYHSHQELGGKVILKMRHKPGLVTILGPGVGISGGFEMSLTFDKERRMIEGFEMPGPDGSVKGRYTNLVFDLPIKPEVFDFKPPANAEPFEVPEYDAKLLAVGSKAPNLTLKTPSGETMTLSDYVRGRKVTLVNFWYFGCGGCMIEFPNIDRLHKKYASQGLGVIGVNPIDDAKTAGDYIKEGAFSFPNLLAKGTEVKPEERYKVEAYPSNYILGPDLTILDRFVGEDEDRLLDAMEKAGIKIDEEEGR